MSDKINKTDEQWRQQLTPQQYQITRQKGTEPAFSGQYYQHKADGTYHCICCQTELFGSGQKYDSGSGWPSFWAPVSDQQVETQVDSSLWMTRTEVHCRNCQAHLGHVFEDGPAPSGLRYCINSASLKFSADNGG